MAPKDSNEPGPTQRGAKADLGRNGIDRGQRGQGERNGPSNGTIDHWWDPKRPMSQPIDAIIPTEDDRTLSPLDGGGESKKSNFPLAKNPGTNYVNDAPSSDSESTRLVQLLRDDPRGGTFMCDIQTRIKRHAIHYNRLTDAMVLNGYLRGARIASVMRSQEMPEIGISKFYTHQCRGGARPLLSALQIAADSGVRFIGMDIELDSDRIMSLCEGPARRSKSRSPPPTRRSESHDGDIACHTPISVPLWEMPDRPMRPDILEQLISRTAVAAAPPSSRTGATTVPPLSRGEDKGSLGIKYISFYLDGWGGWFVPLGDREDDIQLSSVIDFLHLAAGYKFQLVTLDTLDRMAYERFMSDLARTGSDFRYPSCIEIGRVHPADRIVSMGIMAAQYLGMDVLSWLDRNDLIRLAGDPPRNPTGYSFCDNWKLRAEQMAYICLRAALASTIITVRSRGVSRL